MAKKKQVISYGYCPDCGAPGKLRERAMLGEVGHDVCENGHRYPSSKAMKEPPSGSLKPKGKRS